MTPRQKLGKARVRTFDFVPYLASYIYQLRERETPGVQTAAVDMKGNLYWDPKFVESQSIDRLAYTIVHEALHLIYTHCLRSREIMGTAANERTRFILNVAADLVVEQTLACMREHRPDGVIHLGCAVPQLGGLVLDFPPNLSMDGYYKAIMDKLREQEQAKLPPPPQDNESEQDDQEDDADAGQDAEDEGESGGGDAGDALSDEEGQPQPGSGDEAGDEQGDGEAADAAGQSGSGQSQAGDGDADTPPAPCAPGTGGSAADGQPRDYEVEDDGSWDNWAGDQAAEGAEQAIEAYEKANGVGSVPGSLKAAVGERLHPTPDPWQMLRSAVATSVASPVGGRQFSRQRPSRRQLPGNGQPLLYGRTTTLPSAVVLVDTSGSMCDRATMAQCLSVVGQGLRKLRQVRVVCADATIRSKGVISTLARFPWSGGGGTDMAGALETIDREDRPDSIVIVTDSQTAWPKQPTRARVVVAHVGPAEGYYWESIPSWCRKVPVTRKEQ